MYTNRSPQLLVLLAAFALLCACGKPEEAPAAATDEAAAVPAEPTAEAAAAAAAPAVAFDLNSVPVSTATLPAFPWLDWPPTIPEGERRVGMQKNLESFTLIAGRQFLPVEGRIEHRSFSIPEAVSQLEVRRYYVNLIKSLGGVQINGLKPTTDVASTSREAQQIAGEGVDVPQLLSLQGYDLGNYEYESFVIRTPSVTAWIVLQSSGYGVDIFAIEQQAAGAAAAAP